MDGGPQDIIKGATNLQSHSTSNVANVSQAAALAAVTGPMDAVEEMRTAFDRRRRTMVEALSAIPGFECPTPKGAFYAYVDVRGALGRSFGGSVPQTSAELAELILERAKVAVVPGEAFGPGGYFRLSYALGDEDLKNGIDRIHRFIEGPDHMRIGLLTSGGDCPGLNAVIRAAVLHGEKSFADEFVGFRGWRGLIEADYFPSAATTSEASRATAARFSAPPGPTPTTIPRAGLRTSSPP